ncbi:MAG TPA: hypothetical protein VNT60_03405, partial [Deinococcales bacterium]|nr:hypothetical protein [Deinococcales bacterium]
MELAEFTLAMGELYRAIGRSSLEGRFVALLLASEDAVSLKSAAATLGVSKATVSSLANTMLERGDLKRTGDYSSREHRYRLVNHAHVSTLRDLATAARRIGELTRRYAREAATPQHATRLEKHLRLYLTAAGTLDEAVAPYER